MNPNDLRLLLCTNGVSSTIPALEYGAWLAALMGWPATVLGVVERPSRRAALETLISKVAHHLDEARVTYEVILEEGESIRVIEQQAGDGRSITVVGPFGRPAWQRLVHGSVYRHLLATTPTPILYVPRMRVPLRHVLLCMGGLDHTSSAERLTIHLAQKAGAQVTLLHIVEPVLLDYPTARQIHDHWAEILETDTPQGRNLRRGIQEVQAAGLESHFKVLHGKPVHEILGEVHSGKYDLISLGSGHGLQTLRRQFMPDVTAEVAEAAGLPVLAVREDYELIE